MAMMHAHGAPRCVFLSTFLLEQYAMGYHKVQKWTKSLARSYLATTDLIFLPYNKNAHWVLIVVDVKRREFLYCDPFQVMKHSLILLGSASP